MKNLGILLISFIFLLREKYAFPRLLFLPHIIIVWRKKRVSDCVSNFFDIKGQEPFFLFLSFIHLNLPRPIKRNLFFKRTSVIKARAIERNSKSSVHFDSYQSLYYTVSFFASRMLTKRQKYMLYLCVHFNYIWSHYINSHRYIKSILSVDYRSVSNKLVLIQN